MDMIAQPNGGLRIELLSFTSRDGRKLTDGRQPVTVGVPLPRGLLKDPRALALLDERLRPISLQVRGLDHWSDRSLRWVLLDFQADAADSGPLAYHLSLPGGVPSAAAELGYPGGVPNAAAALGCPGEGSKAPAGPSLTILSARDGEVTVETGAAQFRAGTSGRFPFEEVIVGGAPAIDVDQTALVIEDAAGSHYSACVEQVAIEERGALRSVVRIEGTFSNQEREPLLQFLARLHFFAGSAAVRFVLTVRNPRRAGHPGGCWSLGDQGSVYLRDLSLTFALPGGAGPAVVHCSPEVSSPWDLYEAPFELYQDSSGGEHWNSSSHVNRHGQVPNTFRGYRLRSGETERIGLRATPIVALQNDHFALAVAVPHFWQNFPKAIQASGDSIIVRLFPHQYADVHEIQGGEQKTHTFVVAFGRDSVTESLLGWAREPLLARLEPAWYCSSEAAPYLTPVGDDLNDEYTRLVNAAIEGDDTFERKRELIDEYGWRHFGDIYADHEAVFHSGPLPLVSHYNNQYDAIAGFAVQFFRSGDPRWWTQMNELAAHVADIDVYHTERDKAAYNGGLFWHTYHYVDAGTSNHRTYPRSLSGGGPSAEHNYTTGLMLHHFLTGDHMSRQTVIGLAQWVIDMDDGRKTVFRWLDRGPTGLASATGSPLYHGPGRGAANSLNALLDAHRLTGEPRFLIKAEELIRRCIHPTDDVASRDLLDAERRWFYTVFLQALGKYLDYKAERGWCDQMYAYSRASLLHYARWMAVHEYPYLEKPEILEYPTESWAAQDMRKSEVFAFATQHASGDERVRFLERSGFFFEYSTRTLAAMATRTRARPVVLMLSNGLLRPYLQRRPDTFAPRPSEHIVSVKFPEAFVPQKVRAKRRMMMIAAASLLALATAAVVYIAV